jgi:hypothetical protein
MPLWLCRFCELLGRRFLCCCLGQVETFLDPGENWNHAYKQHSGPAATPLATFLTLRKRMQPLNEAE